MASEPTVSKAWNIVSPSSPPLYVIVGQLSTFCLTPWKTQILENVLQETFNEPQKPK